MIYKECEYISSFMLHCPYLKSKSAGEVNFGKALFVSVFLTAQSSISYTQNSWLSIRKMY